MFFLFPLAVDLITLAITIGGARTTAVSAVVQEDAVGVPPYVALWVSVHGSDEVFCRDAILGSVGYVVKNWG